MSEKIREAVVHVVYPVVNFTMTRTILTPSDHCSHQYYCLLHNAVRGLMEQRINSLKVNEGLDIYKNVQFIYVGGISDIENKIKKLGPKFILLTLNPNHKFNNFDIPIYYAHHGMFNHNYVYGKRVNWSVFKPTILAVDTYQVLHHKNKNAKCRKISGLPQFDLILHLKDKYPEMKRKFKAARGLREDQKLILVISSHKHQYQNQFYTQLFNSVRRAVPNGHIILKAKHRWNIGVDSRILKADKNYTLLRDHHLIYDYFFADIIIVHTYGTSYPESLIANNVSILLEPTYKHEAPILAKDLPELETKLKHIRDSEDYYRGEEYLSKIDDYFMDLFDFKKFNFYSDKLLDQEFEPEPDAL